MNVRFRVSDAKKMSLTAAQLRKVEKAVEILNKVITSPGFKNRVCAFNWTDENGTRYNRFHMSNAMSNSQVWNCISNATSNWGNHKIQRANKLIEVVPCTTKADYKNENWTVTSNVCINSLHISNITYTPVHLASAMFHEYCVNCCGFAAMTNGTISEYTDWTVPFACGFLIKDCVASAFPDDFDIQNLSEQCNTAAYNYFPPSMIWNDNEKHEMILTSTACVKVDQTIYSMELELDCLENCKERSNEIADRMTVIQNCIESLKRMRKELFTTSLDGSEVTMMPAELPMHMSLVSNG